MLPFSLKIAWFCLSFTGTMACWVVLCMFSRAIGSYWGPGLYSVFATLLQGIFCLGMIYDMNPLRMPKAFCIVQTLVIYYSSWSLTGVCAAFTFATSSSVLWPSPMKRSNVSTLAWKNKYYFPIFVFPFVCLSISLPILLRTKAIRPTDDLHCDASHPEWGRFLGYAGFPMILTIPCLLLSIATARRGLQLHRNNQYSHYSFRNSTHHLESRASNEHNVTPGELASSPISPDYTTPACADPEILHSTQLTGAGTDVQDADLCSDPDVSPSSTFGALSSSQKRCETCEVMCTIEEDDEFDPRRQIRGMALSSTTRVAPPPKSNIAAAIWRLILFQMAFFVIQCLAALSTIIDVARHRPTPTPFGSQHVALVLVGWGPVVAFGHIPAIRHQLMFWNRWFTLKPPRVQ